VLIEWMADGGVWGGVIILNVSYSQVKSQELQ